MRPHPAPSWVLTCGWYPFPNPLRSGLRTGGPEHERTLRAWVRNLDGTYTEHLYRGGTVRPAALPNVAIDLDELFRL